MRNDLEKLREEIDEIDKQILQLLAKRMSIVVSIGKLKKRFDILPLDKKRWQEIIDSKIYQAKNLNLPNEFVKNIYNLIHKYSLNIEKYIK